MSDEVLVAVENVSKKFCRRLRKSLWYGIQDIGAELAGRKGSHDRLRPDEFWAVNDVSFDLRRGECLGLIGRNGAGKTTLLRMLNGLIKPDTGRITMRGRVGALVALGAGFNPILTGRENIYVNGSVLGLSRKDIDGRIEDIIDFAEIRDFIDSPVQSYSSGMHVRLGFAVATALEPDILLVDEVLAVGDIGFRAKCFDRLERLRSKLAVILVSHSRHDIVRMSSRTIVFSHGRLVADGSVAESLVAYDLCFPDMHSSVYQHQGIELLHAQLEPADIAWGDNVTLRLAINARHPVDQVTFRMSVMDGAEVCLAEWRSENHIPPFLLNEGRNDLSFPIDSVKLQSGAYFCNLILSKFGHAQFLMLAVRHMTLRIEGKMTGLSAYQI